MKAASPHADAYMRVAPSSARRAGGWAGGAPPQPCPTSDPSSRPSPRPRRPPRRRARGGARCAHKMYGCPRTAAGVALCASARAAPRVACGALWYHRRRTGAMPRNPKACGRSEHSATPRTRRVWMRVRLGARVPPRAGRTTRRDAHYQRGGTHDAAWAGIWAARPAWRCVRAGKSASSKKRFSGACGCSRCACAVLPTSRRMQVTCLLRITQDVAVHCGREGRALCPHICRHLALFGRLDSHTRGFCLWTDGTAK